MGVIALALYAQRRDRHVLHPDLGEDRRRARDRRRHVLGRLADHAHARPARLPDGPAGRLRRAGDRRARSSTPRRRYGYPLSTTHVVSGAVMGSGRDEAALGRSLGRRREHRLRLDPHDSRRRPRSRRSSTAPIKAIFWMRFGFGAGQRARCSTCSAQAGENAARDRAARRAALPRVPGSVGHAGRREGPRARRRPARLRAAPLDRTRSS